ncbi:hypothetical protein NQT69_10845 [Pseudoalteromonas shioyasakiensis]|uniref:hypothetical protein n=1 Tax=Pseudoalteromonas shioyasakiensis TaxID=1190813 RepID=UPI0021189BBE|nr:hypothetical protein [Pseudoalteromonas shioyasakiensis]MCQ8878498.1 hypothetical protein [Pseudoalteromonas shioyasakiensis]
MKVPIIFVLSLCVLFVSSLSAEQKQLTKIQIVSDFIPEDNKADRNIANKIMLTIGEELSPDTSLEFIPASRLRAWKQLKTMPDVCLYNKVKNDERQHSAFFNQYPIMAFPANRLVIYNHPELPQNLTLEDVIQKHKFLIGISAGRSYGKNIDQYITSHPDSFINIAGETSSRRLHKMLFQNKLDAILEYTAVLKDRFKNDPRIDKVRFLSIDEESHAVFGYLACSRSEQGKLNIAAFDKVLKQTSMQDQIIKLHQQVFSEPERSLLISALKAKFNLPLN